MVLKKRADIMSGDSVIEKLSLLNWSVCRTCNVIVTRDQVTGDPWPTIDYAIDYAYNNLWRRRGYDVTHFRLMKCRNYDDI